MTDKAEIKEFAGKTALRADIVEKDYVLGWLLAGISAQKELSKNWIFKGGTCLKKCHFETYRLSEDLDWTVLDRKHINERFLVNSFKTISDWVYQKSRIELPKSLISFEIYKNKKGVVSVKGKIGFKGPLLKKRALPKIHIDLTADEILAGQPIRRRVHHPYTDDPEEGISALCYSYEEIFAEKIRALAERARPRDLYDIVYLFRNRAFFSDRKLLRSVLKKKCDYKKMNTPDFDSIKNHEKIDELKSEWKSMLGHQLPSLPPLESYWRDLPLFFNWLDSKTAKKPLQKITEAQELWKSNRMKNVYSANFIIEKIKFSAINRICVKLDYQRKKSIVEPYSFRKSKDGGILLYGCYQKTGQPDFFKIKDIQSADWTSAPFSPRYTVEIS